MTDDHKHMDEPFRPHGICQRCGGMYPEHNPGCPHIEPDEPWKTAKVMPDIAKAVLQLELKGMVLEISRMLHSEAMPRMEASAEAELGRMLAELDIEAEVRRQVQIELDRKIKEEIRRIVSRSLQSKECVLALELAVRRGVKEVIQDG